MLFNIDYVMVYQFLSWVNSELGYNYEVFTLQPNLLVYIFFICSLCNLSILFQWEYCGWLVEYAIHVM